MTRCIFGKPMPASVVTYRHSVGELRQGSVTGRRNVNFVGSAQLTQKQEKAHCWLSQQAFWYFAVPRHSSGQMVVNSEGENAGKPAKVKFE